MRILIVDDDYVTRTQAKTLFSQYGDCDTAPDGEIALKLFERAHTEMVAYDLVALDVDMPEMDGKEVLKKIREWEFANNVHESGREAKVLMVSAMGDGRTIMSSFRQGCEGYLVKPVTPQRLTEALKEIGLA